MIRLGMRQRWALAALWACLLGIGAGATTASAGQLILKNTSNAAITCTVDGWTVATGATFDWLIQVQPNQPLSIGQNGADPAAVIQWAKCGSLPPTRQMNIGRQGPDQTLTLNGQQTRVLNVSLYSFLPTLPGDDFQGLVDHVAQTYQAQHPQVLLNAVLNPNINIYDFDGLSDLLGPTGFDVVELDTLYMQFLVDKGLINPARVTGDVPLPVAAQAASVNGQLYGIPSWLCMDFLYSADSRIQQQTSLSSLLGYLSKAPPGKAPLIAVYNGSWRLPSIYINGYVQAYGYDRIAQATQMPPDRAVINNLVALTDTCAVGGVNKCTNGDYKKAVDNANGALEHAYTSGQASNDTGFSEQSFYINHYGPVTPLYATPAVWGPSPQPLLFSDAFVSSAATCGPAAPCADDARTFTDLMTGLEMKNYIVDSRDLDPGTPKRTLLVSNAAFWQQPQIRNDPLYRQYGKVLATAQPFPNAFTDALKTDMGGRICAALKAQRPAYKCTPPSTPSSSGSAQ